MIVVCFNMFRQNVRFVLFSFSLALDQLIKYDGITLAPLEWHKDMENKDKKKGGIYEVSILLNSPMVNIDWLLNLPFLNCCVH